LRLVVDNGQKKKVNFKCAKIMPSRNAVMSVAYFCFADRIFRVEVHYEILEKSTSSLSATY
jgi:hypothetical protein